VINVTSLVFIFFISDIQNADIHHEMLIFRAQDGEANSLPANDDSSATWIDELRVIKKKQLTRLCFRVQPLPGDK